MEVPSGRDELATYEFGVAHVVCYVGRIDIVRAVLGEPQSLLHLADSLGELPLHVVADAQIVMGPHGCEEILSFNHIQGCMAVLYGVARVSSVALHDCPLHQDARRAQMIPTVHEGTV